MKDSLECRDHANEFGALGLSPGTTLEAVRLIGLELAGQVSREPDPSLSMIDLASWLESLGRLGWS
jgi:hypothetical protein